MRKTTFTFVLGLLVTLFSANTLVAQACNDNVQKALGGLPDCEVSVSLDDVMEAPRSIRIGGGSPDAFAKVVVYDKDYASGEEVADGVGTFPYSVIALQTTAQGVPAGDVICSGTITIVDNTAPEVAFGTSDLVLSSAIGSDIIIPNGGTITCDEIDEITSRLDADAFSFTGVVANDCNPGANTFSYQVTNKCAGQDNKIEIFVSHTDAFGNSASASDVFVINIDQEPGLRNVPALPLTIEADDCSSLTEADVLAKAPYYAYDEEYAWDGVAPKEIKIPFLGSGDAVGCSGYRASIAVSNFLANDCCFDGTADLELALFDCTGTELTSDAYNGTFALTSKEDAADFSVSAADPSMSAFSCYATSVEIAFTDNIFTCGSWSITDVVVTSPNGVQTYNNGNAFGGAEDYTGTYTWSYAAGVITLSGDFPANATGEDYDVEVTVMTSCDNAMNTESTNFVVSDDVAPNAKCDDEIQVGLGGVQGAGATQAFVSVDEVNEGSWDNCGPVMLALADANAAGVVVFDCADVDADGLMVTLIVTDMAGNESRCMTMIDVVDKTCPDLIVSNGRIVESNLSTDPTDLFAYNNGAAPVSCGDAEGLSALVAALEDPTTDPIATFSQESALVQMRLST